MGLADLNKGSTAQFTSHRLHELNRSWPETNCYIDLWIEMLASFDMIPEASLGFTVTQNFGHDQFNFSKIPLTDIELLYGINIRELSIYQSLEQHTELHVRAGNVVLLEADAYYLPDTIATTYRQFHRKTTIAVKNIDVNLHQCSYLHNAARAELLDKDYLGVFRLLPHFKSTQDILPPYVEVVEPSMRWQPINDLKMTAFTLLQAHFMRRPLCNPFTAWRKLIEEHVDMLLLEPNGFHDYAFHFPRLAGSNFELLGSHLEWLSPDELHEAVTRCSHIAQTTKVVQFRLARSIARGRKDFMSDCFDRLEEDYVKMIQELNHYVS